MSADTTGAAESQADEATQPQAGTGSPPQAGGAQTAQVASAAAEGGTGDFSALQRERDEARREAAKYRTELRKLEQAREAADTADLTELQRAQKRIAELETAQSESQVRERDRSLRLAAVEAATKLGFRSPDIAYRLLDQSEVEWSDDGTPKHVERLLRAVLEREPYLAKTNLPDLGGGPRGATPSTQPGMNDLLRAAARGG